MKIVCTRFSFATTVGIISGHPRFDKQTALLIDTLQAQSKEPLEFVGVIGKEYSNKLSHAYASSEITNHDEIVITRNYKEYVQDTFFCLYRTITHYKNAQLLNALAKSGFYQDLQAKNSPALITVGGYSLIQRVFRQLNEVYEAKNQEKPLRLGFDLMNAEYKIEHEKFLDFLYYRLSRSPSNLTGYIFPSMCIGYEGLFKAFQFLLKNKSGENMSIGNKQFSHEVDGLVRKARAQYRKLKGYTQDQYLILLSPGNSISELNFSFKKFNEALKAFSSQSQIKDVNKDFFKVLVLLPEDQKLVQTIKASAIGSAYEVNFIGSSERYGALCASDYAVLHNGEVTVEAAACQLPAIVINSMSNYHAYISYLYNGHESPLNVSTDYEGYEELLGSLTALGSKIATSMVEHFKRPKLRYHYVKLYRDEIQKQLMMNGRNSRMDLSKTGTEVAAADILRKISLRKQLRNEALLNRYERKQKLELV